MLARQCAWADAMSGAQHHWKKIRKSMHNMKMSSMRSLDWPNSYIWILRESMDLPDIFHSVQMYNYYGK